MLILTLLLVVQPSSAATAPAFQRLVECRNIADAEGRLSCFDREAAVLQGAAERREVVVMDQQQVRQTRRSLFGLSLPRVALFADDAFVGESGAPEQVEDTIRGFQESRERKWIVRLEDATWQATEVDDYQSTPRVGQKVVVRRGSLGRYIMAVEGRRGLSVIRLR